MQRSPLHGHAAARALTVLRRIPEIFAERDVAPPIGARLFEIPLRDYAANCRYARAEEGAASGAIERTRGTDTFAHCLAFTTMHLGSRVAESGIRGYDLLARPEGGRSASRLAGLIATHLVDRLETAMRTDVDEIGFRRNDPHFEVTIAQYRGVSEIMYPDSREMRAGLARDGGDTLEYWAHALDHAIFIETHERDEPAIDPLIALVAALRDTLESFYLYFLATAYGDDVYEKYGI